MKAEFLIVYTYKNECMCAHKEYVLLTEISCFLLFIYSGSQGGSANIKCLLSEPSVWHQSREKTETGKNREE